MPHCTRTCRASSSSNLATGGCTSITTADCEGFPEWGCGVMHLRLRHTHSAHFRPQAPTRKRGRPSLQRSGGAGAMTTAEVVAERRAALRLAVLERGSGFWLAKQRWLWRHNRYVQQSPAGRPEQHRGSDTAAGIQICKQASRMPAIPASSHCSLRPFGSPGHLVGVSGAPHWRLGYKVSTRCQFLSASDPAV